MSKKFILLLGVLLFNSMAFAHGSHHSAHEDAFAHAADEAFFLKGTDYLSARQEMEKLIVETEHPSYPAPWQAAADFIEEAFNKRFWVRLSGVGIRYWKRYGKAAVGSLAAFEAAEHSVIPVSGLCIVGQTLCVTGTQHLRRSYELVRYRYPINQDFGGRIALSAKQLRWNLGYWWNLKRNIRKFESGTTGIVLDAPLSRYYHTREKIAFLEMQLLLAIETIDNYVEKHEGFYLQMESVLATVGRSIDSYSTYLAGLAVSAQPIENASTTVLDKNFQEYFENLNTFFGAVERGSVPLTTPLGIAIWKHPRELLQMLRNLQEAGCETLLSGENGAQPRYRSPLLQSPR